MLKNKIKDEQTKYSISREIKAINEKIRRLEKIIKCGEESIIRNTNQFARTIKIKTSILETKIKTIDRENETLTNYIAYQNNRSRQFKEIIKRGY